MSYDKITPPETGTKIEKSSSGGLNVADNPIIPYIEGDGIGVDITPVMRHVLDEAVKKAYNGEKQIQWFEMFAGAKAVKRYGEGQWLPDDTLKAIEEFLVAIKGPLTTPVGGGIRSLNVAIRQKMDLYACVRPVKYYKGTPSPVKEPEKVDMVIYRENSEDIYAGIEYRAGSEDAQKLLDFMKETFPEDFNKIRFGSEEKAEAWQERLEKIGTPERDVDVQVGLGLKPMSYPATERLVHSAISYAIENRRDSVTLVHKGNIMKFTEGAFRDWGYKVAKNFFGAEDFEGGPWQKITLNDGHEIVVKDVIADAMLQQILTRPDEYDVIATLNLNGDYISDALAAQVGGIGIAPGANINYVTGCSVFEATHGTAPKYAGQDKVNPGSLILSGVMMLRYMGWNEAADLIEKGLEASITQKTVTYDLERQMEGAALLKCSEFGDEIVENM